ncbi:class I SAM-dependent RNA methyltransferase [Apibacter muscae]|uniref:THUMP domain-containing class I SAM-dependent RNA methyltransferase n=1 Tax=Apibacter muscae TaxID=2509004 RepID=UPI0011AB9F3B|nr:THUMP domain-containing protein [Apibacter muscae]TWP27916.1 class I SAM-dependent RNA methyltransferase [Apibacter muscae]
MDLNINSFVMQAKTFYGLEEVLAQELRQLGATNVHIKNRAVEFQGDLGFLYKANYSLRCALKILVPIYKFKANNDTIFEKYISKFNWENYFFNSQTFAIDSTVYSEEFKHSQYIMLKMKDAIVDRFRNKFGKRPNIDAKHPDIKFHLHISNNDITISLDSSGDALFKRGYRSTFFEAPINEVLAAGMLHLAGWEGKGNFLDPMCGSGTLLIEAAMIALNIPPQLHRKRFGFENWKNFDLNLFNKIKETRLNRIKDFNGKIVGFDIDKKAVETALKNVKSADLTDFIEIYQKDFFTTQKELFPTLLIFNPPYNERLNIEQDNFYQSIGNTLKTSYKNTLAWFITSDLEAYKKIGLRPSRKIKLFNGKLECRFFNYDIYEGSKKNNHNG